MPPTIFIDLRDVSYVDTEYIAAELTYRSYRYNRQCSPDIRPDQWVCVFGADVWRLEQRYQADLAAVALPGE